ncbi:MAG: nucleotide exchange factor GrpE [Bacteroidales bacterium]|nr:nucleotide exchange factor GrpE [Bacteroidales bacterium]
MSKKEHNTEKTEEIIDQQATSEESTQQTVEEPTEEQTEADKLQEMGEKLASLNDKYLRLYSEYENYRKRTNLEKADLLLNGSREMMKAILPVVDDFERALAATGDDEGVRLIYSKMMKILEQKGLKAMESKGEKFDESMHEAVTQVPAIAPDQKGLIIDVVEKGYYLNDKVLRYAKVVVAC